MAKKKPRKTCDLPLQYGLPCACCNVRLSTPRYPDPALLHPPLVAIQSPRAGGGWERSADPSIAMEGDQHLIIKQDEVQDEDDNSSGESGESRESDSGDTDGGFGARSQRTAPGMTPGMTPEATRVGGSFRGPQSHPSRRPFQIKGGHHDR